jgi:hypothetical protein
VLPHEDQRKYQPDQKEENDIRQKTHYQFRNIVLREKVGKTRNDNKKERDNHVQHQKGKQQ